MTANLYPFRPDTPYALAEKRVVFLADLTIPGSTTAANFSGPGARMDKAYAGGPHMGAPMGPTVTATPTQTFRWATADYAMLRTDANPRQYDGRVSNPGSLTRSISLSPIEAASITYNGGALTMINVDGALDTIFDDFEMRGCPIDIRFGIAGTPWADFTVLCRLIAQSWDVGVDDATINLGDPTSLFDDNIAFTTFTGDGGINGTADLAGQMRPIVYGEVYNMAPVLVDEVQQIYQANDGPVLSFDAVRDGGMPLTLSGNVGSYAVLEATSVPPGSYATWRGGGCFKLGSIPVFRVTADVTGRTGAGNSLGGISIALKLAQEVKAITGSGTGVVPLQIDETTFNALALTGRNEVTGWVVSEPTTYRAVMDILVGSVVAFWGANRSGAIFVRGFDAPDPAGAIVARYDDVDISQIDRISMPEGYEAGHRSQTVLYARNWSTMTGGEVAAAAPAKWGLRREWASYTAPAVVPMRAATTPENAVTALRTALAAQRTGDRMQALHGRPRQNFLITVPLEVDRPIPDLGEQVHVTHPRFGLSGGRVLRVITVQEEYADGTVTLTAWG